MRELAVLSWRCGVDVLRNPMLGLFHVVMATFLGVLVGGIFFRVTADTTGESTRSRTARLHMAPLLNCCYMGTLNSWGGRASYLCLTGCLLDDVSWLKELARIGQLRASCACCVHMRCTGFYLLPYRSRSRRQSAGRDAVAAAHPL